MPRVLLLVSILCTVFTGCVTDVRTSTAEGVPNRSVGQWQNRHAGDKDLIAVWIQQLPDNSFDAPRYEGKHPCMIGYIFRSGRQHLFHHLPDGTVESAAWVLIDAWQLEGLEIVYDREAVLSLQSRLGRPSRNT